MSIPLNPTDTRPFDKAVADWFKTDFVSALNPQLDKLIARLNAATTPPSTLVHKAAEEIAANYEVHKDHCHSNERYPSPPCDCGTVEEIAAIIERCLAGGSESGE